MRNIRILRHHVHISRIIAPRRSVGRWTHFNLPSKIAFGLLPREIIRFNAGQRVFLRTAWLRHGPGADNNPMCPSFSNLRRANNPIARMPILNPDAREEAARKAAHKARIAERITSLRHGRRHCHCRC